jgi:hypothetical protein
MSDETAAAIAESVMAESVGSPADAADDRSVSAPEAEPDAVADDGGFKPIDSQEALDNLLKGRLERAQRSAEKKYQKQMEELAAKVAQYEESQLSADEKKDKRLTELEQSLAEATDRYTKLERTRLVESLAREMGLPEKFWSRVQGTNDDEIISDINDMLEGLPRAERNVGVPSQQPTVSVSATNTEPEVEENPKNIVDKLGSMFPF